MRFGTGLDDDDIYSAQRNLPHWGQDREAMKNGNFTGLPGVIIEDFVIAESMDAVSDRSGEFLCAGDAAVVRLRRRFLESLDKIEAGDPVPGENETFDYSAIRSIADIFPETADWRELGSGPMPKILLRVSLINSESTVLSLRAKRGNLVR